MSSYVVPLARVTLNGDEDEVDDEDEDEDKKDEDDKDDADIVPLSS